MALALALAVVVAGYALAASAPRWWVVGIAFAAVLLLGLGGSALWLGAANGEAAAAELTVRLNAGSLEAQLNRLVSKLQAINTNSETIDVREIGAMITSELGDDVRELDHARSFLSHYLDRGSYADLMIRFDDGQRCLHQAQSASAQGDVEQVWDSLGSAEQRMAEAYVLLKQIRTELTDHPSHN